MRNNLHLKPFSGISWNCKGMWQFSMIIKNRLKMWLNDSLRYTLVIPREKITRKSELVELGKELFKAPTKSSNWCSSLCKCLPLHCHFPPKHDLQNSYRGYCYGVYYRAIGFSYWTESWNTFQKSVLGKNIMESFVHSLLWKITVKTVNSDRNILNSCQFASTFSGLYWHPFTSSHGPFKIIKYCF